MVNRPLVNDQTDPDVALNGSSEIAVTGNGTVFSCNSHGDGRYWVIDDTTGYSTGADPVNCNPPAQSVTLRRLPTPSRS